MLTLGTQLCSRVNILPGTCSTKHIIHFFQFWVLPTYYLVGDIVRAGAGVAGEAVAVLTLLHNQPVPTAWAEEQHRGGPALCIQFLGGLAQKWNCWFIR